MLCPFLLDHISPATAKKFSLPSKWSAQDTNNEVMTDELEAYFAAIKFFEPTSFFEDLINRVKMFKEITLR